MDRESETNRNGGVGPAVITGEVLACEDLQEAAPSSCRWPTLGAARLAMHEADGVLGADPLFYLCPDGHQGKVEVRCRHSHPLNFSCRHCSEGHGVRMVDPETEICQDRRAHQTGHPVQEG